MQQRTEKATRHCPYFDWVAVELLEVKAVLVEVVLVPVDSLP